MSEPDWSDLKIFLMLTRAGSVAGAARELGVDGSTVSRRLAALEKALGARLILRGGREFSITAEGKSALTAAQAMENSVVSATSAIRAAKRDVEGVVRISFVGSFVPVLLPLLESMAEKYPRLTIEIKAENRLVDIAKNEADIAMRMVRPTEPDLIARRAFEMAWAVYASKAYAAKRGLPACHAELVNHHLVHYTEELHRQPGIRWIEDYRSANAPITRVNSTDMAMTVIASGKSIGVVPCFEADSRPEFVRVFPAPVYLTTGWIVYHETARNTSRIRVVVDALVQFLESRADFLLGKSNRFTPA